MKALRVAVLALAWLAGAGAWAQAPLSEERVALVIGNAGYPAAPLQNPRNDAKAMALLLSRAGFKVDQRIDTDQAQLKQAIERFGAQIRDPKVKFGLFYYAGHGLQLNWRNYLVPVSADIRSAEEVAAKTVDVSELFRYMNEAKGRSFLIILDACRDDPFAGAYRPPAKGLSQFDAPVGSLLAYATSPGNVAYDGEGVNGLYTTSLLQEMEKHGEKVEDVFKRVRLNVRVASRGRQVPWETTSLEEDVYLFPTARKRMSESELELLLDEEIAAWSRVKSSSSIDALANFLRKYPSGNASELAQSRLSRILSAQALAQGQQEDQKRAAEAQAKAEEERRAEDQRKLAQARQRAQEEEARIAREEAQLRAAEAARKAREEEATRVAEAARRTRAEEEQRATETARLAREAEQRQAAEVARIAREEESKRVALAREVREAEERRLAEATRQAREEEQRRVAEARKAQQQVEADRLAAAARKAREDEEARIAVARRAQEEEAQRVALADGAARERATREAEQQASLRQQESRREAALLLAQREAREQAVREQELAAQQRLEQARREEARLIAERTARDQARREAERLAALAQAQAQATQVAVAAPAFKTPDASPLLQQLVLAPTPFSQGYVEHQRQYQVGDSYRFQVIDQLTKLPKPLELQVTAVDAANDRVEFNGGEYVSDLMGNIVTNQRGVFSTPRQFYPAEIYVGKKWRTTFKQQRANGISYTFRYDVKVVGRETITVPAGTFEAYKIEARGFNMQLGAALTRNIWIVPGIAADIAHETMVRLRNNTIDQYDRQELMSLAPRR